MSTVIAGLRGVSKSFGRGDTLVHALQDISLDISAGELTLIEGPSGSGKTTLLHVLGLLQRPDAGEVWIDGRRTDTLPESALPDQRRRHIAFIFQGYNLLDSLTVADNVAVARLLGGSAEGTTVEAPLQRLRLGARRRHLPEQLSGGEKQRTAIARALASPGRLVLADEPTGNLDWANAQEVARALTDLAHAEGRAVVMVSHDARLHPYADRIVHLLDGRISGDHRHEAVPMKTQADIPDRPAPTPCADAERAPTARSLRRRAGWLIAFALVAVIGAIYWPWRLIAPAPLGAGASPIAPSPDGPSNSASPTPYVAAAPAVVEPASQLVTLRSERQGRIRSILKRAGDRVAKGEPLVILDDATAAAVVRQRKADLSLAAATLARLRAWDRPEERAKAKAGVDRAQARLDRANRDLERVQALFTDNSAPATEVSMAIEEQRLALAALDEARQVHAMSEAGPVLEEVAVAQARVEQAQAAVELAEIERSLLTIVSPLDGHVIYRHLEPGEVVDPEVNVPILSLGNLDQVRLRAEVDEADIERVFVGQRVVATAEAFGERSFTGRVVHLEPLMGRKSIRTQRPTEQQDTKVREVLIEMDAGTPSWPIDLQMTARFVGRGAGRKRRNVETSKRRNVETRQGAPSRSRTRLGVGDPALPFS